ncbi:hypothetical protein DFJ73DRAFT_779383 [Zopfochytrium polystomum]|nr:hypothetical protein DFJ73DRAFT_779383 [Zopfochytrium polystomum]
MFALIRKASTDGLAAFVPGVVAAASGMNGSSSAQEVHLLNGLDPTQVSFDRDLMSPPTSRRKPNINPDSQSTTTTAPSPHETSIMDDGLFSLHGADNSEGDVISSGGSSTNQPSSGASIHVVVAGTMELLGVPELEEKLTRLKKFELKYPGTF